jgi:signal transduction histidine kinase
MIAIILYVVWEQRREAREQAQENALRVARLAAMQQERLITGAEHFLMALAELPEVREHKAEPCSRIFTSLLKKFPYYTNIAAATPEGEIFCAALPRGKNTNISDRSYFQEALRERHLGVSYLLVGRMSGKPNISIAYPVFDSNGPVRAIVFVGLDLTWLNSVAARAQMPPRSVVTAIDERGVIFSRYPDPEKWIGKATDTRLFKIMLEQKEGVTEAVGRDGVARLYGFTPLYRFADNRVLFVNVGIPNDIALAPSRRILLWSLIVIALAAAFAVAATWIGADLFIKRKLKGVIDAARTLADDKFSATRMLTEVQSGHVGRFGQVIEEMKSSLRKVTRHQADLAAMIAHDVSTPVSATRMAASLLKEERAQLTADQIELVNAITSASEETAQTVKEFLDFSRFSAGYLELHKRNVNVSELIQSTEMKYRPLAKKNKLRLAVDVSASMEIYADRHSLERLLGNLLHNAVKFTASGGVIEMGARDDGPGIKLWVKDTGIGMSPTDKHSLFAPYRRITRGKMSHAEGTGLGLVICKLIAESHGGRIWVESALGQGSSFYVWIPRKPAEVHRLTATA